MSKRRRLSPSSAQPTTTVESTIPRSKKLKPTTQSEHLLQTTNNKFEQVDQDHPKKSSKKLKKKNSNQTPTLPTSTANEIDFPRGGGIPLSAFEQAKAKRDGAREAERDLKSLEPSQTKSHPKKRNLSESRGIGDRLSKGKKRAPDHEPIHHVPGGYQSERLCHKSLIPGIKLAGVIVQVRPLDLVVALPCQLIGHVPITEISSYYTNKLEEIAEEYHRSDRSSDDSDMAENTFKGLDKIFRVGQWIRCSVLKTTDKPKTKARVTPLMLSALRVTLTLDPLCINSVLEKSDLQPNLTLTGAIRSIEDRGYIIDFGVPIDPSTSSVTPVSNNNVTAFVSFADAAKANGIGHVGDSPPLWEVGQVIWCTVKKLSENGATCVVSVDAQDVSRSSSTLATNIDSILPLHMVSCLVTKVIPDRGLYVNFLGFFNGSIDVSHIQCDPTNNLELSERFKVGQKLCARVLWDTIPSKNHASLNDHEPLLEPKVFSLSLLDHVIKLDLPGLPAELRTTQSASCDKIEKILQYPVGYIFQTVRVYRVQEKWGLRVICLNGEDGLPIEAPARTPPIAFAHIASISDDGFLDSLPSNTGPYKIGSTHKARVTGVCPIDGLLQVSLKPSLIEQAYMRPEDIPVGAFVHATVEKLTPLNLFVKIDGRINGIVWPHHYSDFKQSYPEKKFSEGSKVEARVLHTNAEKNQATLTLRKSLLRPDIEIITSYQSARVGTITSAMIRKVEPKRIQIEFFGHTQGMIPIRLIKNQFVESLPSLFTPGQLVMVKIIDVDVEKRNIVASIKNVTCDDPPKKLITLKLGSQVSAVVTAIDSDSAQLDLRKRDDQFNTVISFPGLINLDLLAEQRGLSPEDLKAQLKNGDELQDLVIKFFDKSKKMYLVAFETPVSSKSKPTLNQVKLEVGDEVVGIVRLIYNQSSLLHLRKADEASSTEICEVEGFLPISLLAQHRNVSLAELKSSLAIGQEISGLRLIEKHDDPELLIVGFTDSESAGSFQELYPDFYESKSLSISDRVAGRVHEIQEKNIVLVLRKEDTEAYIQDKGVISIQKVAKSRCMSESELRSKLKPGDYIYDLMVRKKAPRRSFFLVGFVCHKTAVASIATSQVLFSPTNKLSVGDPVIGTVEAVHENNVVLSVRLESCQEKPSGPPLLGVISSRVLAGHWRITTDRLKDKLSEGQEIRKLVIKKMNPDKGLLILGFPSTLNTMVNLQTGSILKVCINKHDANGHWVTPIDTYPEGWKFLIDFTDSTEDYDHKPSFEKGAQVEACVIQMNKTLSTIFLSTRQTDLNKSSDQSTSNVVKDRPIRLLNDLRNGDSVRGFVQKVSSKTGLKLQVGTNIRGTVKISELFDEWVERWKDKFHVGQVVSGKVTCIDKSRKVLQMSLRENPGLSKKKLSWEHLKVGQTYLTKVLKIERYGMFLGIPKSRLSGLCHCSQLYDDDDDKDSIKAKDEWSEDYRVGMELRASIIRLDTENSKVNFTIKPSVVKTQANVKSHHVQKATEIADKESDEDSDEDISSQGSTPLGSSQVEQEGQLVNPSIAKIDFAEPSLPISTGFSWQSDRPRAKKPTRTSSSESEVDESTDTDDGSEIETVSQLATDETQENSVEEVEKLLIGSPNSSQLWIRLIALYVQKVDIPQARLTAQRALEAIHYREEGEKWRVWVCLLKLENTYGTEEQFLKTFNDASVCNDTKKVWLKVAEIHTESGKLDKADEIYNQATKKFRQSSKVWSLYAEFCLKNSYNNHGSTRATDLLSRSLKSLPQRKHIKTISKFAQSEFKFGEVERGRTLFEGLIASYPKRLDLWNVYTDLEIKLGTSAQIIRGLFSRMLTMKLNPKRTKSVFKKWLNFEKKCGDQESQQMVIQKAQAYVNTLVSSSSISETHEQQVKEDQDEDLDEEDH